MNRFRLVALDDNGLRLSWSVVHGDRRFFADLVRPAFDGSLTVRRISEHTIETTYEGDCFPNIEAQLQHPSGVRINLIEVPDRGPEYGLPFYPGCEVSVTRTLP